MISLLRCLIFGHNDMYRFTHEDGLYAHCFDCACVYHTTTKKIAWRPSYALKVADAIAYDREKRKVYKAASEVVLGSTTVEQSTNIIPLKPRDK